MWVSALFAQLVVDAAVEAGASFVVSPGQSDELFERALLTDVPFLPGAVTATEVMAAKSAGFTILKFFLREHRAVQLRSRRLVDRLPIFSSYQPAALNPKTHMNIFRSPM